MSEASASRPFDKRLYVKAALDEAIEAFADFATLSVATQEQRWLLTVTTGDDADYPAELLASEIANFALAQTISRKR